VAPAGVEEYDRNLVIVGYVTLVGVARSDGIVGAAILLIHVITTLQFRMILSSVRRPIGPALKTVTGQVRKAFPIPSNDHLDEGKASFRFVVTIYETASCWRQITLVTESLTSRLTRHSCNEVPLYSP
jgi:hypothetical protein